MRQVREPWPGIVLCLSHFPAPPPPNFLPFTFPPSLPPDHAVRSTCAVLKHDQMPSSPSRPLRIHYSAGAAGRSNFWLSSMPGSKNRQPTWRMIRAGDETGNRKLASGQPGAQACIPLEPLSAGHETGNRELAAYQQRLWSPCCPCKLFHSSPPQPLAHLPCRTDSSQEPPHVDIILLTRGTYTHMREHLDLKMIQSLRFLSALSSLSRPEIALLSCGCKQVLHTHTIIISSPSREAFGMW